MTEWADSSLTTGTPGPAQSLINWNTISTVGWSSGHSTTDEALLRRECTYAAVLRYPSSFFFSVSWPLAIGRADTGYSSAHEWRVAAELLCLLVLAGAFYEQISAVGQLTCALNLAGFAGAVPDYATHGRENISVVGMPSAPNLFREGAFASVGDLRSSPQLVGRRLLDFDEFDVLPELPHPTNTTILMTPSHLIISLTVEAI